MDCITNENIPATDRFASQSRFHIYTGDKIAFVSASDETDSRIMFIGYVTKESLHRSDDPLNWEVVLPVKRKVKRPLHGKSNDSRHTVPAKQ